MVHCPSCGAGLHFDIASQQMHCDYCQSSFDPQHLYDNTNHDAKAERNFEGYSYICPSCGAELMTYDKQDAVGFCPYCGGASMLFDKIRTDWKCEHIIPFSVTKEQCKEAYIREVKRHPFVSRKYCKPDLIESFRGIYMPYWSYRAVLNGKFHIEAEHHHTGAVFGTETTKSYRISGKISKPIEGYTHDASLSFDDHISEKLAPYETGKQVPFNPGYLCGFYAETGDINYSEYSVLARRELEEKAFEEIINDPNAQKKMPHKDLTMVKNSSTLPLTIKSHEKSLYPVWFMSYRQKDKLTYAAVNGQTGKVAADLPLSPLRIIIAALGVAAVLYGLLLLIMSFAPSVKASTMLGVCSLLLLGGLYITQDSFVQTISRALRSDISVGSYKNKKSDELPSSSVHMPVRYLILLALAIVAIIGYTSDGSYDRDQALICLAALVILGFSLVPLHFAQAREMKKIRNLKLHTESLLKNGILQEAKKLLIPLTVIRYIVYGSTVMHLWLTISEVPSKTTYYLLCLAIMGGLFAMAMVHVNFQVTIAKRRPPQFNKKGARSDEK
ncbi:MAG: hypothetical protein II346_08320 [Ruminococcus sp.]|nr:hypothetical protein [Ruminococcus sp.]